MRLQRLSRGSGANGARCGVGRAGTPETYDQWLLAYLQLVTNAYTAPTLRWCRDAAAQPTGAHRLVFSGTRPDGGLREPGIHVRFVDGDHFTMFPGAGLQQMAAHIAADLALGEQIPAGSLSE